MDQRFFVFSLFTLILSIQVILFSHDQMNCITFNTVNADQQYWNKLREEYKLDELVVNCDSDIDRAMTVMHWVSSLWKHNGDNVPVQSDPLYILDQVINHHQNFRCVEYAKVTRGCLIALGLPCRIVCLKTQDCQTREYGAGHVVCEVYLQDMQKWVMLDPQFDIIPVLDEFLLNAMEFGCALNEQLSGLKLLTLDEHRLVKLGYDWKILSKEYYQFIQQYLFYFDTPLNLYDSYKNKVGKSVMFIPMGALKPLVFQKSVQLDYLIYTDCVSCFYPKF